MNSQRHARVVRQGEGTPLNRIGAQVRMLALGEQTGGHFGLSVGTIHPGAARSARQQSFDEGIFLLAGAVDLSLGNQEIRLSAGGFINIRPGTAHRLTNFQSTPVETLTLWAPPIGLPEDGTQPPAEAFQVEPNATVRQAGEGPMVDVVGDRYTFLATGEDTGGRYALWEALVPPGGGPPPHVHSREEEGFFILEGNITFLVEGERLTAGAGDFIHSPPGIVHVFKNASDRLARMLILVAPAGLERMFFQTGLTVADRSQPLAPPTQEEIQRLLAAAPSYGVQIRVP